MELAELEAVVDAAHQAGTADEVAAVLAPRTPVLQAAAGADADAEPAVVAELIRLRATDPAAS